MTYTDEDWAKDVRWLVAPPEVPSKAKDKGKSSKRRHSVSLGNATNTSLSLPESLPRRPPSAPSPVPVVLNPRSMVPPAKPRSRTGGKGFGKGKGSMANRSVVGMTVLLEVEEDPDPSESGHSDHTNYPSINPPKRSMSHSSHASHKKSSSLRRETSEHAATLARRRSASTPVSGGPSPSRSSSTSRSRTTSPTPTGSSLSRQNSAARSTQTASNRGSALSRRSSAKSRATSTSSHVTSTTRSPYTTAPVNGLDILEAHAPSTQADDLPSKGTRGFSGLVLPRAAAPYSGKGASTERWRPWKGKGAGSETPTVGFGDRVDLSRDGLAQTTMATVEIVRGIASKDRSGKARANLFGVGWFSKDKSKRDHREAEVDIPLGFAAYRSPPSYVGGNSVLVQVWAVGLDGTDARLVGLDPSPSSSSLGTSPYSSDGEKFNTLKDDRIKTPSPGYTPGRSFVGRVLETGWEVREEIIKRGEWVYGLYPVNKSGALAEFIIVDRHRIHRVPHPWMSPPDVVPFQVSNSSRFQGGNTTAEMVEGADTRRSSLTFPSGQDGKKGLTIDELALLPLIGFPAHRAVRSLAELTHTLAKPHSPSSPTGEGSGIQGRYHHAMSDVDQEMREDMSEVRDLRVHIRPRILILRAHDGPGALALKLLVRSGWSVWAHVPVPFPLPGPKEPTDEETPDDEESEKDARRSTLHAIETRLRDWGAQEVLFVPITHVAGSPSFMSSLPALRSLSLSSASLHQRSPPSSPYPSQSPYSLSSSSTPLSSPFSHILPSSQGHSSATSYHSSGHHPAMPAPYSFSPLPLSSYHSETGSVIALQKYLSLMRVQFDAVLDTLGGREVWEAGRTLLSQPAHDKSRQDVPAQFTTTVGDIPDRIVATAGDHFRAGVRSLRVGSGKDLNAELQEQMEALPPEMSTPSLASLASGKRSKRYKEKPRVVQYSWVNIVSDVDWDGSDVRDTLYSVLKAALDDKILPDISRADFKLPDKGKGVAKRAAVSANLEGGKVVPFENTPSVFKQGGGLEYGGTIVSRIVG